MQATDKEQVTTHNVEDFKGGWFIGDFSPSLERTQSVEVALKHYKKGDTEASHFHKVATEYTLIIKGRARLGDQIYTENQIIKIPPNNAVDFEALEDTTTTVVKIPGAPDDKYLSIS